MFDFFKKQPRKEKPRNNRGEQIAKACVELLEKENVFEKDPLTACMTVSKNFNL